MSDLSPPENPDRNLPPTERTIERYESRAQELLKYGVNHGEHTKAPFRTGPNKEIHVIEEKLGQDEDPELYVVKIKKNPGEKSQTVKRYSKNEEGEWEVDIEVEEIKSLKSIKEGFKKLADLSWEDAAAGGGLERLHERVEARIEADIETDMQEKELRINEVTEGVMSDLADALEAIDPATQLLKE